ncbi:MAG: bifunctional hydroxymethylpyrimidine kinase/phosphomethylpyrimidine kinase [Verrucomicrobiota bacterium]
MPAPHFTENTPVALTVAGSDCSAGAGLQADLKTFAAFKVFGLSALTCAVSETPHTVSRIEALPPDFLADQVRLLLTSYPVAAIKTGMLFSKAHVDALADTLEAQNYNGHFVVDPVMTAGSGSPLVEPDAVEAITSRLFPRASIVTPNLGEASTLVDHPLTTLADLEQAASSLRESYGVPFLIKGGHLTTDDPNRTDALCIDPGHPIHYEGPFIDEVPTHGTGCTYAAAIAAGLAKGDKLPDAVRHGHAYVANAIRLSYRWTQPAEPIHALNHQTA